MASTASRGPETGLGAELKTGAAAVPPDQAERIAQEKYGLTGRVEWLWGEKDSNYRLTLEDGTAYLLKILNPAEDPAVTSMHSQALLHVAAADPAIPVQRIIRTVDGEADFVMTDSDGATRGVRMVTFLPGLAQKVLPHSALQRYRVGVLLGRMQTALEDFRHEAAQHRITWDMKHAGSLRNLLCVFSDTWQRSRLERAMDDFEMLIAPRMEVLPAQVIHNDFNMENILVVQDDPDTISGIIDFGDMVHAPVLFDVAVGAAYQIGDAADPVEAMCDFLRGYATQKTLSPQELALLYPAIATRMLMRVAIPEWRSNLFPENRELYTRNSATVWAQFVKLDAIPKDEVARRLAAACSLGRER
ncbi:phosphotransferase [Rhizobium sp. SL86]|uniref:phosphotransferase n=1 Tax=Rhizobium sp. SL86 TaxID=2995148 RepID=UPI0022725E50|nr:phosphotransferase [Rhizobium sp. SL86]MCY1666760.1 phosphotransferase [Rhizobium sp. SL86]